MLIKRYLIPVNLLELHELNRLPKANFNGRMAGPSKNLATMKFNI